MSLTAVYERFLASPNPLNLTEDASLHYIPTLKSFIESGPVIRHLESQNREEVKIKSAKTINAVEGSSTLVLEVDTTMQFSNGGGAYLPGLDSFIDDKVATLPLTHIVQFNHDQKITQVRISWDQASLLKQVEVIGSRGRGWPITDGKDQVKLITGSKSIAPPPHLPKSPVNARGRVANENGFGNRSQSPAKKHIKDPYTSLDLFGAPESDDHSQTTSNQPIAPRAESFKPPPRDMSELFAAGHEDNEPGSPKKSHAVPVIAPKGAGSQRFGPMRVFEEEENVPAPKIYKTNPARYNHFDIGDEDENDPMQHKLGRTSQSAAVPMRAKTDKHASQWGFSDFSTPAKVSTKVRDNDKVHFSLENASKSGGNTPSKVAAQKPRRDADAQFEFQDDGTPVERKNVPKPRKDARSHFEFDDQPTPAATRIIARTDAAKGLYRNVLDEDESAPLANISNNAGRRHDFDDHWAMKDDSPANSKTKGVNEHRKKAVENMDANWGNYDQSPQQTRRPTSRGYQKGLEPQWSNNAEEEEPYQSVRPKGAGAHKGFWDF